MEGCSIHPIVGSGSSMGNHGVQHAACMHRVTRCNTPLGLVGVYACIESVCMHVQRGDVQGAMVPSRVETQCIGVAGWEALHG